MAEEIKPIIKVDTGESQKTVKSLKKEISDLKDHILNLTKGTDEYNEAVTDLQSKQRELDEVMALTKKTATALDGSYDALTHRMSLLKKEWRATADEARRAEIGQEIAEINAQLKEMDASVGNFQRNVGNYVSHWEGMPDVVDEFGDAVAAASAAPKDFGTAMREMNESIEPTKQGFESVGNIASGLASGFAAVQGAMALCGVESENFEKTMIKIQAAMALAQGVSGLKGLVEGIGKAKVAFAGLGDKIKAVSKTMGATGWIAVIMAVIAAVTLLVSWIKSTKDESEDLEKSLEKLSEKHKQMGSSVGNAVGKFKLLQREFSKLKDTDKQKWIDENAEAFSSLGLAIKNVNDANKIFLENSDKIIEALKLQAEAAALNSIYQQAYGEAYAKKRDIDARTQLYKSGYEPTDEEKRGAGLSGMKDFQTYTYTASSTYGNTGTVGGTTVLSTVNSAGAKKLQAYAEQQKAAIDAETTAILDEFVELQKKAKESLSSLGGLITNPNGNGGGGTKTPDQIRDELVAQIQAATLADLSNMVFEDDFKVDDEVAKKSALYTYKDGDAEKRADIRIGQEERIANRLIELNNMTEQSEEERAAKEFQIRQDLEQKKLDLLKQFKEEADRNGDALGSIELAQEIADQELAIEKAKYEEKLRLDEEYKQKKIKITEEINQTISAAASVTQGILEITQAAYEKDGEISEKEAKKIKGMQIAIATMNMLAGITAALSGAFTTKSGPWDIAMAAVQAATIAASGTANIMKIKNTDLTGNVPSGAMGAVTPNSNIFGTDIPFSYVRNVTSASETDALNQDNRVYILESDIQASNKKVSVRESESSF